MKYYVTITAWRYQQFNISSIAVAMSRNVSEIQRLQRAESREPINDKLISKVIHPLSVLWKQFGEIMSRWSRTPPARREYRYAHPLVAALRTGSNWCGACSTTTASITAELRSVPSPFFVGRKRSSNERSSRRLRCPVQWSGRYVTSRT